MRYRNLLLSLLSIGLLGSAGPAAAGYDDAYSYNLQRTEIHGTVDYVGNQECYILTDDGAEVGVRLGPQSYWDERGYYLPEGAYVDMDAWYDPNGNTDWYFAGEIWGDGFHIVLANDYGVPYWVLYDLDYYYTRGYRASCVSYMVWYDCPPFYFVYLVLPPPPPLYYSCYYGPQWGSHCRDWYHGSRYGRDGSYWQDGRGYDPPRRRDARREGPGGERDDPRWNGRDVTWHPPLPAPARPGNPITTPRSNPRHDSPSPRVTPKDRHDRWQTPPVRKAPDIGRPVPSPRYEPKDRERVRVTPRKGQTVQPRPSAPDIGRPDPSPRYEPKGRERVRVTPRKERSVQPRPSAPPAERKIVAPKAAPRERKWQDRAKSSPPTRVAKPEIRRDTPPPANRSHNNPSNGNRSGGNRNSDRGRGRR